MNKYLDLPYGNVQISFQTNTSNINTLTLQQDIKDSSAHRWTFNIGFTGGRDEDLSNIQHEIITNRGAVFEISVPQNPEVLRLLGEHNNPGITYPGIIRDRASKDGVTYTTQTGGDYIVMETEIPTPVKIPAGMFLKIPGSSKLYMTAGTDEIFRSSRNDNAYHQIIKVTPRILKYEPYGLFDGQNKFIAYSPWYQDLFDVKVNVKHSTRNQQMTVRQGLVQATSLEFIEDVGPHIIED